MIMVLCTFILMKNSKSCLGWVNTNCCISDTLEVEMRMKGKNLMKGKILAVLFYIFKK